MIKKVYSWNKFNEELSPIKLYAASTKLNTIGLSNRSKKMSKVSTELVVKFIDNEIGIKNDRYIFLYMEIIKQDKTIISYPVLLQKNISYDEVTYRLSIPFLIEINGFDIQIVKTIKYIGRDSITKPNLSNALNNLKNYIIETFTMKHADDIKVDNMEDEDRYENMVDKIFYSLFPKFEDSFYNGFSESERKSVLNMWRILRDFDSPKMKKYFKKLQSKFEYHKIDSSIGQVQEFIRNLKVNDLYAYK
jgi:hypothetical protein